MLPTPRISEVLLRRFQYSEIYVVYHEIAKKEYYNVTLVTGYYTELLRQYDNNVL